MREILGLSEEVSDKEAAQKEMEAPELFSVYCTWEHQLVTWGNDARAEYLEIIDKYSDSEHIQAEYLRCFGFAPWVKEPGAAGVIDKKGEGELDGG